MIREVIQMTDSNLNNQASPETRAGSRRYRQVARAAAHRVAANPNLDAFMSALHAHWIEDITLDGVAPPPAPPVRR